jgi:hypothetical protein
VSIADTRNLGGMNESDDDEPREIPENMRLIDFQQYLETRGLRNEPRGIESELNVSETNRRVEDEAAYQAQIHDMAFRALDEKHNAKLAFLETLDGSKVVFNSANGAVEADVKISAARCDTIYALVTTRDLYKENARGVFELSLAAYSLESVQAFVNTMSGRMPPEDIPPQSIVECCHIAHYLQCNCVLEPVVDILVDAVDNDNCKSLLELADQLNLPLLFERSLSHMMQSLEETQAVWEDLPSDLRDRIELMKQAMQSAVLADSSRLYFASMDEYLAMFAETLTYHRERLMDAKQRQEEIRSQHFVRSRAWEYNQIKIENQEKRFLRLEQVMKQQKNVFATNAGPSIKKERPS